MYSENRSCLVVENIGNLMIINLIGLPFSSCNATPLIKKQFRKNHSVDDNRVKKKKHRNINDNQKHNLEIFKVKYSELYVKRFCLLSFLICFILHFIFYFIYIHPPDLQESNEGANT